MQMKVVMISLDSVRSDFFGPESRTEDTPNIDRICEQGAYFPETIVQAPFTAPSHGSMLTGELPYDSGIRNFDGELRGDVETVFEWAEDQGLETSAFLGSGMLKNRGFDSWDYKGYELLEDVKQELKRDEDVFCFVHYWNTHTPYKSKMPNSSPKNTLANAYLKVSETLGLKRGYMGPNDNSLREAWRLGYKFFWSHRMEELRNLMREDEERARKRMIQGYKSSIREADEYIGSVLQTLEELDEEFVLIVTSDHGESFNEHGERDEFREFEHGYFLHQNVLRVPTVVYGDRIDAEKHTGKVRSIDIVPTIKELISSDPGEEPEKGLFSGENSLAYSESHRPPECDKKSVQDKRRKVIQANGEPEFLELPGESPAEPSEQLKEELERHVRNERENKKASEEDKIKEQLENLGYR
ncbi:MAG: sulfatase-like hydrolase/transferase [Candidatus Nanohalobium sp.]